MTKWEKLLAVHEQHKKNRFRNTPWPASLSMLVCLKNLDREYRFLQKHDRGEMSKVEKLLAEAWSRAEGYPMKAMAAMDQAQQRMHKLLKRLVK